MNNVYIFIFVEIFIVLITIISLKNGISYGAVKCKKSEHPILYWLGILLNVSIALGVAVLTLKYIHYI
jgi:hypothetical protein